MFGRRVFGGAADAFRLHLEFGSAGFGHDYAQHQQRHSLSGSGTQIRLPVALCSLEFDWNSDEGETAILDRFDHKKATLLHDRIEQRVVLELRAQEEQPHVRPTGIFMTLAANGSSGMVSLRLSVTSISPVLRTVQFRRQGGSGTASDSIMQASPAG